MKSLASGVKLRHGLVCLYQDRALVENLQHLICGSVYLLWCSIAQVNDKSVFLISLVIIERKYRKGRDIYLAGSVL